ncbi:MAG: DUF664 domain-containing protein [Kineosporiaceae bacterium]
MFAPGVHTEIEELAGYLDLQFQALRNSAFGLSEEQARLTPCRSTLSIGGLLKHATYVCEGRARRRAIAAGRAALEDFGDPVAGFLGSFALTETETLADILEAFDTARQRYLDDVRGTDPDARVMEPPAPWYGRTEPTETAERYALVHHVEELARHAGHADIIREQIDGATAASLAAAVDGRPANPFVTPWQPAS